MDPRSAESLPVGMRHIENEIRGELERDALIMKAKAKLQSAGGEASDPLNSWWGGALRSASLPGTAPRQVREAFRSAVLAVHPLNHLQIFCRL